MNRKQHFRIRVQGESLEEKIQELSDKCYEYLGLPTILFTATIYFWMIFIGIVKVEKLSVGFIIVLFFIFTIRAFIKIRRVVKEIRQYRKGLDGERYVGSIIEKFSSRNTFVFHDIICERNNNEKNVKTNIDHVIVSTKGIFTIDTKNWYLPDREYNQADFVFKNNELIDSTGVLQTDLMRKVEFQGRFMENKIKEWLGVRYPVYRVGIMIGAFVNNIDKDYSKYWFVNDVYFPVLFEKEREKIPLQDVLRISDSLKRFVEKPIR